MFNDIAEIVRILRVLPSVEFGRRKTGPEPLISSLRLKGRDASWRNAAGRRRLRSAIRFVDRWMPDGGNCFRRVLLEVALDREAAAEPIYFGLLQHGGPLNGHVWLVERDVPGHYDAEFVT